MNKLSICIILQITCVLLSRGEASEISKVNVPYTEGKIGIDGKFICLSQSDTHIGEKAWKNTSIKIPVALKGAPTPFSDTDIYMLHDKNYLYMGIICRNESEDQAKAGIMNRDLAPIWDDSCIEIFINLEKNDEKYQFIINNASIVYDSKNADVNADFNIKAFALWDTWSWKDWYLEIALPIAEIDPTFSNDVWKINISRTKYIDGKKISRSLLPRGEYFKINFQADKYKTDSRFALAQGSFISRAGKHQGAINILNPDKEIRELILSANIQFPFGKEKCYKKLIKLSGKEVQNVEFQYAIPEESGDCRFSIELTDFYSGKILFSKTKFYNIMKSKNNFAALNSWSFAKDKAACLYLDLSDALKGNPLEDIYYGIEIQSLKKHEIVFSLEGAAGKAKQQLLLPVVSDLPVGHYVAKIFLMNKKTNKLICAREIKFCKAEGKIF